MNYKSVLVLGDTDIETNPVSEPIQAGGYYSLSNGKHRLVVYTGTAFQGRIYLEGTLSLEPKEEDWFNIPLNHKPFQEFPIYNEDRTVISNNKVYEYNFEALPTYIRVKVDREYLKCNCPKCEDNIFGNIRKVLLVY